MDGSPDSTHDFYAWDSQNKSTFISCNCTMQKRLPFVPSEQNVTYVFGFFSICLSFNSRGTHLPVFWIFHISRGRSETTRRLTSNCSASCFCICESSSSNNARSSTSSHFLAVFLFLVFLSYVEVTIFESPKPSFRRILRWSTFFISFSK